MLPLFLVLLSFGSCCFSAPTPAPSLPKTQITEVLEKIPKIEQQKFQGFLTPTYDSLWKKKCTHKNLKLFIEGVESLSQDKNPLLSNLKAIQKEVEKLFPQQKGSELVCDHGEENLQDFKKKFEEFLNSILEQGAK